METNEANGASSKARKNSRDPSTVLLPGLRAARLGAGMTQVQLSASSGVGRASLSKLENVKRTARPATALKIARGLGVELDQLVAPPKAGLTLFPISPEGRGTAYLTALRRLLVRLDFRLGQAMEAGDFKMGLAEFAANVEHDVWDQVVPEMRLMQGIGGMPPEEAQAHELFYDALLGLGSKVQDAYDAAVRNLTDQRATVVGFDRLQSAWEGRERAKSRGRRRVEEARSA